MKTIKFFKALMVSVFLLAGSAAFTQANPLIGKTYIMDIMGIDGLRITFDDEHNLTAEVASDQSEGKIKYEKTSGTYTFFSNNTVSAEIDNDQIDFVYEPIREVLTTEVGDGMMLELRLSRQQEFDPNAVAPDSLAGRTYKADFMGVEFISITFVDDKKLEIKPADEEAETCEYTYDKATGKITINGDDMDEFNFRYEKGNNTLQATIAEGLTLSLTQR